MTPELTQTILTSTGATTIVSAQHVQTLWSGYGNITRYRLTGKETTSSIIVKHIQWPEQIKHPRGWNTELSHQRKLKSYQVECHWYQNQSKRTDHSASKLPLLYGVDEKATEILLILEDLNVTGYPFRLTPQNVTLQDVKHCLKWLAHFHAKFLGEDPKGLWPIGTYWHLDTRPEELERMNHQPLKAAAPVIDQCLNNAKYQTLVHGDAKLANFCFGSDGKVAAVDFQYVGKGCGMKDVAYLISSCFEEPQCELYEKELLDYYFTELEIGMDNHTVFQSVKKEWMKLYQYAWADFYRFLDGWSPGHWKMHGYSRRLVDEVLKELNT